MPDPSPDSVSAPFSNAVNSENDPALFLWDRLAAFPDSEIDSALEHLMLALQQEVGAEAICWIGFQGPGLCFPGESESKTALPGHALGGWDAVARRQIQSDPERIAIAAELIENASRIPSLSAQALAHTAGEFRVRRLRDGLVDMEAYQQTSHFDLAYRRADIRDRIFVGHPVEQGAESFLLIDRIGRDDWFTESETIRISRLTRPLAWLHRKVMLAHGIIGSGGVFDAMERRLFRLLLTSRSEPQIAEVLGQAPTTTHKYVTTLFRKMRVKGRPGFFARWSGNG